MSDIIFLLILAIVWILFATIQDLKSKEIANWLSFSLIAFAIGFRFFYSLFFRNGDFSFFYQGIIGLGIFFVIGNLLYYGKMFAGGDAKLMIAMGAVLPLSENFPTNLRIFILFFLAFLFVGAVYGISVSFFLGLKNFKLLKKEFVKRLNKNKRIVSFVIFSGIIFIILGFVESLFFIAGILMLLYPLLYIYAKSIEETCMIKRVDSRKLREGDWLYNDLRIGKRIIKSNWEGLSINDIRLIQKKRRKVLIKEGVAFTPVFLISFLILIILYFLKVDLWNSFW